MIRRVAIAPLLALFLTTAALPVRAAESLTGAWNCQAANGQRGVGRRVTFHPDGRFDSRMALQVRVNHRGTRGLAKLTASMEGRWKVEKGLLVERVTSVHHIDVTVQEGNRATRLKRSEEAEAQRRALQKQHIWRYRIRSLSGSRMTLDYLAPKGRGDSVRISCRRL